MRTDELMLNRAIGRATPEDHIEWAVTALAGGEDTPGLRVLAGLSPVHERHEIEPYFLQSVEELGLVATAADLAPRRVAAIVRRLFERGALSADDTVARMSEAYRMSEYSDPILAVWMDIEEELMLRGTGHEGVFYPPEALASLDAAVRVEWSLLDRAAALELPDGYERFVRCDDCSRIGLARKEPASWVDRLKAAVPWPRRGVVVRFSCPDCGSERYRGMSDPDVRDDFFSRLESGPAADSG